MIGGDMASAGAADRVEASSVRRGSGAEPQEAESAAALFLRGGPLESVDLDLLHLQHRLHDPLRLLRVRIAE